MLQRSTFAGKCLSFSQELELIQFKASNRWIVSRLEKDILIEHLEVYS